MSRRCSASTSGPWLPTRSAPSSGPAGPLGAAAVVVVLGAAVEDVVAGTVVATDEVGPAAAGVGDETPDATTPTSTVAPVARAATSATAVQCLSLTGTRVGEA